MSNPSTSSRYQSLRDPLLSTSTSFSWRIRGNLLNGIPISPRLLFYSSFPNRGGPWKFTPNITYPEADDGASDEADETRSEADADSCVNESRAALNFGRHDATAMVTAASAKPVVDCRNTTRSEKPGRSQKQSKKAARSASLDNVFLEMHRQLMLACPMIGVNLMQYLLTIVSLMFLGHLGELELASGSVAISLASVLGYDVLVSVRHFSKSCVFT